MLPLETKSKLLIFISSWPVHLCSCLHDAYLGLRLTTSCVYFSGSTGKPKGILHTCGGYMIYAATTFKYVFDYQDDDIYWCTADVGWITGHTYVCYGPLACGATSVIVGALLREKTFKISCLHPAQAMPLHAPGSIFPIWDRLCPMK